MGDYNSKKHYIDKPCVRCGTMMQHVFPIQKYCPVCRKIVTEEQKLETQRRRRARRREEEKKKPKPLPTGNGLHDVCARADAAGRSYGKQVAFERQQKEAWIHGR